MQLILSLFHGVDLLGRGFESEGFCVVRAAEKVLGFDIRDFHAVPNKFDGIIAGSPCQDFSVARRNIPPTGEGIELLQEFCRVVDEAQPSWFLLENVPAVPDISIEGYHIQRFDLRADECGGQQKRLRHFQFGSLEKKVLLIERQKPSRTSEPAVMATAGKRAGKKKYVDFCRLQGLTDALDLPSFTTYGKYEAIGNGVNLFVSKTIAKAIRETFCEKSIAENSRTFTDYRFCLCGCGRILGNNPKQKAANSACRKRLEKARKNPRPTVTRRQSDCAASSQFT